MNNGDDAPNFGGGKHPYHNSELSAQTSDHRSNRPTKTAEEYKEKLKEPQKYLQEIPQTRNTFSPAEQQQNCCGPGGGKQGCSIF